MRMLMLAVVALVGPGCDLIGPSCVARQHRGSIATITGEVGPGQRTMHRVAYGVEGSQNDVTISWSDQFLTGGPKLRVYATRVDCVDFAPSPPAPLGSPCATLASGGSVDIGIATTLTVTHGRGNPEILGSPPEYKLWVFGDAVRTVNYTLSVSYFYGPDC